MNQRFHHAHIHTDRVKDNQLLASFFNTAVAFIVGKSCENIRSVSGNLTVNSGLSYTEDAWLYDDPNPYVGKTRFFERVFDAAGKGSDDGFLDSGKSSDRKLFASISYRNQEKEQATVLYFFHDKGMKLMVVYAVTYVGVTQMEHLSLEDKNVLHGVRVFHLNEKLLPDDLIGKLQMQNDLIVWLGDFSGL